MEKGETKISELRLSLAAELFDKPDLEEKARRLIENRSRVEHDLWEPEPEINARTAIFEELTAKGHLSRVQFDEPPDLTNERTLRRLVNGWSDQLPDWEMARRFHEIVEELSIQETWEKIRAGELPSDTVVITISDFPEMCDDYVAPRIGYRALNKKGMVRVTDFENGVRTVEQISRSNSNDGSSVRFFASHDFVIGSGSEQVLSNQLIGTKRDFANGVVDVQKALDSLAGPGIIYGERAGHANLNLPSYEELRQESMERESQAAGFIEELAAYDRHLDLDYKTGRMSYRDKQAALDKRRRQIVNQIILMRPSYAKDARGEAAAEHFEQASLAMAAGDDSASLNHLELGVSKSDPNAGVVCGGSALINPSAEPARAAEHLYMKAKAERKNWKWGKGICVVKECPTRPAKTDVGPCEVCRKCQSIFDSGKNPKSVYRRIGIFELLFGT